MVISLTYLTSLTEAMHKFPAGANEAQEKYEGPSGAQDSSEKCSLSIHL